MQALLVDSALSLAHTRAVFRGTARVRCLTDGLAAVQGQTRFSGKVGAAPRSALEGPSLKASSELSLRACQAFKY